LDIALALGTQPPLKGDNVVMITNGGGSGLLSCDHFERIGLPLKELGTISPMLVPKIRAYMPMFGSPLNPVDISGTATPTQYKGAISQAMRDPNVDALYVSICPTAMTDLGQIADTTWMSIGAQATRQTVCMECQGGTSAGCYFEVQGRRVTAYTPRNRRIRIGSAEKICQDKSSTSPNKRQGDGTTPPPCLFHFHDRAPCPIPPGTPAAAANWAIRSAWWLLLFFAAMSRTIFPAFIIMSRVPWRMGVRHVVRDHLCVSLARNDPVGELQILGGTCGPARRVLVEQQQPGLLTSPSAA
jgi:hypothetical protein